MMTYLPPLTADEWNEVPGKNKIAVNLMLAGEFAKQVLKGQMVSLAVFGGSGMGKNYVIDEALKKYAPRDENHRIAVVHSNALNELQLRNDFHTATFRRNRPLPMIMNEARNIFTTPAQMNIMKEATDSRPGATRFWPNHSWKEKEEYEVEFKDHTVTREREITVIGGVSLRTGIIAMTNMALTGLNGVDIAAIKSRMQVVEIPDDPDLAWEYTIWLALTTHLLTKDNKGVNVPLTKRVAIIDWFTANQKKLEQVSVRTLVRVRDAMVNGNPALCTHTLNLLLVDRHNWRAGMPPQQQDWGALRMELGAPKAPLKKKAAQVAIPTHG